MGYRSEIAIAIKKEALPVDMNDHLLSMGFRKVVNNDYRDYVVFHADSFKWYTCDDDVRKIDDFLFTLQIDEYSFIRLGEDFDDNEERGDPYEFDIWINRSIVIGD